MLPATSTKKLLNNGGLIGGIIGALSGVLITITVAVAIYIRKSKGKCYMLPTLAKHILYLTILESANNSAACDWQHVVITAA